MTIEEKIKNLPENPGVYIMYGSGAEVLYVGKAKNLKNRVKQYFFISGNKTEKVMRMVEKIADFRYIITASETDALSLENNLIKEYKPPYNILLKDDKQYPYLKVDVLSKYPKITLTRKILKDKSKYFGPIMGGSVKDMFKILEIFPTATCKYDLSKLPKNFRACLNADLGKCCAPCINKVSVSQYADIVKDAMDFLNGEYGEVKKKITEKMMIASENEQYETALSYKQQLSIIEKMREQRLVNTDAKIDADIFAIAFNGKSTAVGQLTVRAGKLIGANNYSVSDASLDLEQNLTGFLMAFYSSTNLDTKHIFVNLQLPDKAAIEESLQCNFGKNIEISVAKRGIKRKLTDMAYENAEVYLDKSQTAIDRDFNSSIGAMEHLKDALNLPTLPRRIECFDISNISGVDKVASMTVFSGGIADNKNYRRFKIKTVEGADDFKCMNETLVRRLLREKEQDFTFGVKPDLIVVDGGKGQLSSALEAMEKVGIFIPVVALAEKEELIYVPNESEPIRLPKNSFGLNLLINIRDEAHRFAITYFRGLHSKNILKSELDAIKGVGAKKQSALIKKFKSIDAIMNATIDDLIETEGINKDLATEIKKHFLISE
ncbi:MAG: excinuclease ABC subunit UvrC [Clostridia bacterium]